MSIQTKKNKNFSTVNRSSLIHFHQLSLAPEPVKQHITPRKFSGEISVWGRKKELMQLDLPGYNIA